MRFDRGDLVLIPFPFTDLSSSKRRPVLALTPPNARGDFVGLPVTSQPQPAPAMPLQDADLQNGRLPKRSWVRVDHPITLSGSLVIRIVAHVRAPVVSEGVDRLCLSLRPHPAASNG